MAREAGRVTEKKIYKGMLIRGTNGEEDNLLVLLKNYRADAGPLADVIKDDIQSYGDFLTVRYYISSEELSPHKLQEEHLKTLIGIGDAQYSVHYSEITGYLWTDEEITVGGHDLLEELKSYLGKWLWMEIEYNES